MIVKPVIYRISYSIYDEVARPLPQFYFYVEASDEQQALAKLNAYAEAQKITYRSVAVGYTLSAEDLPLKLGEHQSNQGQANGLNQGIAIKRDGAASTYPNVAA